MPYELYRRSTLGLTLADALDDMIQSEQLTPHLAMRVLAQFDRSMMECLDRKIRSRCILKVRLWHLLGLGVLKYVQIV